MLKIKQIKNFKKDFAQYRKDIENIKNDNVKKECHNLLNKLVEEYNYIDATHDIVNKTIDPIKIRENVERSILLRQKLNKIIKESKEG
jgi:hypothetical protein